MSTIQLTLLSDWPDDIQEDAMLTADALLQTHNLAGAVGSRLSAIQEAAHVFCTRVSAIDRAVGVAAGKIRKLAPGPQTPPRQQDIMAALADLRKALADADLRSVALELGAAVEDAADASDDAAEV